MGGGGYLSWPGQVLTLDGGTYPSQGVPYPGWGYLPYLPWLGGTYSDWGVPTLARRGTYPGLGVPTLARGVPTLAGVPSCLDLAGVPPPPGVNRQTPVKTVPSPTLRMWAVTMRLHNISNIGSSVQTHYTYPVLMMLSSLKGALE